MHNVMNRYLNKITPAGLLRSPPNEGTMGGSEGGNGGGGNESGNSNGSDSNNSGADNGNGSGTGTADEDDDDLFSADDEDESLKIEDEDESADSFELSDDQKAAGETLKTNILSAIDGFKVDMDSIPDDLDLTDKKQLSSFLATQQQKAMRATIAMVPTILNHALGVFAVNMEKKLGSAVNSKSRESEATQIFNDMGYTGKDRALAKTFFERGLAKKMSPKDAKKATEKAMKGFGITGGKSSSQGETSSKKEGAGALDGFFGKM